MALAFHRTIAALLILDDVFPLGPHPLDLTPAPHVRPFSVVEGDLYVPAIGRRHPGIILVNGAVVEGRKYPALVGAATALARAGYAVLVPELGEIRSLRVGGDAVRDLVVSIRGLQAQPEVSRGPVGLFGFSLGGSLALLAAEDPEVSSSIAFVADLGGYYRLADIIQAATTRTVPGARAAVTLDPLVVYTAVKSVIQLLDPGPDRDRLADALASGTAPDWLRPFDGIDPSRLDPPDRALLTLIENRDPARVDGLFQALDPPLRHAIEALSPSSHPDQIQAPVWALHDVNDPFIPSQESQALASDPRLHGRVHLILTSLLKHTEFLDLPRLTPANAVGVYAPNLARIERFVEEPLARL